jgi:hypothetical protein
MYLNDVDINKRSMNKICLGILWILVGITICLTICGILWSTYADVGNECEMNAWIQVECFVFLFFLYDL